jgi:hypothetical protein
LTKLQGQGTHADFEHTARNGLKKLFSAKQETEMAEYFEQAAELHYGLTKKEACHSGSQRKWYHYARQLGREQMCC